jgi:hypothetical protein
MYWNGAGPRRRIGRDAERSGRRFGLGTLRLPVNWHIHGHDRVLLHLLYASAIACVPFPVTRERVGPHEMTFWERAGPP